MCETIKNIFLSAASGVAWAGFAVSAAFGTATLGGDILVGADSAFTVAVVGGGACALAGAACVALTEDYVWPTSMFALAVAGFSIGLPALIGIPAAVHTMIL